MKNALRASLGHYLAAGLSTAALAIALAIMAAAGSHPAGGPQSPRADYSLTLQAPTSGRPTTLATA
jgi:hypothetical protein